MSNIKPLAIKKHPDKILRSNCIDVKKITSDEAKLFEMMLFTMKHYRGIGLAALPIRHEKEPILNAVYS
ncbi:MAG: peptide deformylase [Candidatus Auribacterota bacterium]|nr:peptide deformylase [Candidatus Auribacterota bacterium]